MYNEEEFRSIVSLLLHNAITQAVSDSAGTWGREVIDFLISRGADVNIRDYDYPLLSLAVMGERMDIVRILLSNGTDVNITQDDGNTALHCAAELDDENAVKMSKYLVEAGAAVDSKNQEGKTPLHCVVNRETAELLVKYGANFNSEAKNGETPLHSAARSGRKSIVKFLIESGAKINLKDSTGRIPLHWAVEFCPESVQQFISAGARLNEMDGYGRTPLDLAQKNSNIYNLLKRNKALHSDELPGY